MIYPIKANLIPLLENLATALQPFAKAYFVQLRFQSNLERIDLIYHPENLLPCINQLLCRVITLTPQNHQVLLEVIGDEEVVRIRILNTGVSLDQLGEILAGIKLAVRVEVPGDGGTLFELQLPIGEVSHSIPVVASLQAVPNQGPLFFKQLRESLRSHFSNIQNLEKVANARDEREGVFLKKVNAVIFAHLDRENFDAKALGKAMALSRAQLYRRLTPLTGTTPAHYIRYIRLQRAKEMLDQSEMTAGEVAFKTGFMNQSHFTRAFRAQFGYNPSDLKRNHHSIGPP